MLKMLVTNTNLFAVAGLATLLATGAQAFDGGSPAGLDEHAKFSR